MMITSLLALVLALLPGPAPVPVIDAGCQPYGIVATAGQTIENVTIRNASVAAIQVEVNDVTIRHVTIEHGTCSQPLTDQYMAGVACWYCDRLTVEDSTVTVSGDGYGNGIWVKENSKAGQGGHRILRNTIQGGYDGIGCETEDSAYGCFVRDTLIEGNVIEACRDDGIQVEGRTQNVTVRGNTVSGCGTGIALAPSRVGPLLIEGNTLRDMRADSDHGQQNCFKVGDGGSGVVTIRNNRCVTIGDGIQQSNSGLKVALKLTGNCFQVTRYVLEFTNQPKNPVFTGNTWNTTDPSRFVKWNGNTLGRAKWASKFPGNTVGPC